MRYYHLNQVWTDDNVESLTYEDITVEQFKSRDDLAETVWEILPEGHPKKVTVKAPVKKKPVRKSSPRKKKEVK